MSSNRDSGFIEMQREDNIVEIYTDGACSGNPGPGGYGAVLKYKDRRKEISGGKPNTTNNRMELTAVIEALGLVRGSHKIRVVTDSNYVVKGMTEWLPGWIKKRWMNSRKAPVLNRDLWEKLLELSRPHDIEWKWIRGHEGHVENERCDELARNAVPRRR